MSPPHPLPRRVVQSRSPRALVCALFALAACTAPAPTGDPGLSTVSVERGVDVFTLGPSDLVLVEVLGHRELSTSEDGVRVDPQGFLHLPLVGSVEVTGRTLGELNRDLAEAYGAFMKEPVVTASILDYASRTYHVLGNVAQPGSKTMDRPLNALEALSQGGSFRPGADRDSVFLLRPHGETLEVHEFDAATPDARALVQVRPGDVVYVRQKGTQNLQEDLVPILSALGLNFLVYAALDS